MIHLNILVEGQTELRFVKQVLAPFLAPRAIYTYPLAVLTGRDRRSGRPYRGGVLSYVQVKADLLRLIKRDRQKPEAWFTSMIDLYKLPRNFPGFGEAATIRDPWRRVAALEATFAKDVGCHRFLPYIQLHEYEALLLVAPARLQVYYAGGEYEAGIGRLQDLVGRHDSPEEIDDGETTAPSKRIIAEIPAYQDDKAHAGPLIAHDIGLPSLRAKCPHFHEWISRIEALKAV